MKPPSWNGSWAERPALEALPALLDSLKERGFELVTIPELLQKPLDNAEDAGQASASTDYERGPHYTEVPAARTGLELRKVSFSSSFPVFEAISSMILFALVNCPDAFFLSPFLLDAAYSPPREACICHSRGSAPISSAIF